MNQQERDGSSSKERIRLDAGGGAYLFVTPDRIVVAKIIPRWIGRTLGGIAAALAIASLTLLLIGTFLLSYNTYLIVAGFLFLGLILTVIVYEKVSRSIKSKTVRSPLFDQSIFSADGLEFLQWSDILAVKFLSRHKLRMKLRRVTRWKVFSTVQVICSFDESMYLDLKSLLISKLDKRVEE
jgi:hypothetical protein